MFNKILSAVLLTLSMALPGVAHAQGSPIKLESEVQVVRPVENGEEELAPAEGVVPGDTLVFTTSYRNEGAQPVSNFVIVNPVSAELLLSDDAATQTEVSVDGGNAWGRLGDLTVADNEGQQRPATARDVTHIRWVLAEVPAASGGQVQFSATVR